MNLASRYDPAMNKPPYMPADSREETYQGDRVSLWSTALFIGVIAIQVYLVIRAGSWAATPRLTRSLCEGSVIGLIVTLINYQVDCTTRRLNRRNQQSCSAMTGSMAFQFSTRTMLLVTACFAVVLACLITWVRVLGPTVGPSVASEVGRLSILLCPFWIPVVLAAYAIGRRQLTVAIAVVFAECQVAATVAAILIYRYS
jgi:hypothetical protein